MARQGELCHLLSLGGAAGLGGAGIQVAGGPTSLGSDLLGFGRAEVPSLFSELLNPVEVMCQGRGPFSGAGGTMWLSLGGGD